MKAAAASSVALALAFAVHGCAGRTVVTVPDRVLTGGQLAEFWVEPDAARDLYWGIGGPEHAPDPDAAYALVARDDSGFSVGYDVTGPDGGEWSVKVGPEAQTEVVVSRILWGLGYHQPPVYYLPSWRLQADGVMQTIEAGRFRPKLPRLERLDEPWRWQDNPFMGTREFRALLVALLMLNSTDLKDENNSVYQLPEPWDGTSRWFVVRDLGAALGEIGRFYPRRNWIDGFERQPFITRVEGERVEFDYDGLQQELLSLVRAEDVRLAARMMARLVPGGMEDAFRAAGYPEALAGRFIGRIRQKIEDGLAVRVDAAAGGGR